MPGETYISAGVDLDGMEALKGRIKALSHITHGPEVLGSGGGFAGVYRLPKYTAPVMVASTDGVGTKLKIASHLGHWESLGIDLGNLNANDVLTWGARPLFFLDYFAAGQLDVDVFEKVVSGLSKACRENECVLIGGETAEMPDFYTPGDYDISGTIVGVAEKSHMMPNRKINRGDFLIGLPSTGLHTNGYSLARKVLLGQFDVDDHEDDLEMTVGEALLSIHKSYLPILNTVLEEEWLVGISHITGGVIIENTMRILGDNQTLDVDWKSWERPAIFTLIQELGNVPESDLRQSMNLGIGMILIIKPDGFSLLQSVWDHMKDHHLQPTPSTQPNPLSSAVQLGFLKHHE